VICAAPAAFRTGEAARSTLHTAHHPPSPQPNRRKHSILQQPASGRKAADPGTDLAEREAASTLIESVPGRHRITVGADRAYDTAGFVAGLRELNAIRAT
jgi:hypothetical protein